MNTADTFRQIADQAANGDINLPASVNAALRLQTALDDPECPLDDAIKLVGGEPQLAARVVALANSAAFNRNNADVTNVRAAIMRVGYKSLKTMASSMVVRQLGARINDAKLRAKAERLWLHTVNVAALSHVLARRVTRVDADTAMFAGIVHEVGGLYLLSRAEEFPGLLDNAPATLWGDLAEETVTRAVLAKLLIPDAVSSAILTARLGAASATPSTLAETLVLANEFALVASPLGELVSMPEPGDSELDFVIDSSKLTTLIDESTDELRSIVAALT